MRPILTYGLLFVCLLLASTPLIAQKKGKAKPAYKLPKIKQKDVSWKATRLEYLLGIGPSGFLGDLGGQDGVGQPFVADLEPTQTRYSVSLGARYFIASPHAIRGTITYARLRGDDGLTNYAKRRYRNIRFKSPLVELAGIYEFHFLKPKFLQMSGAKTTKLFDGNRLGSYLSAGVGAFYFNSKSEYEGTWYALQPLNTEGQGLPGGPDPYKRLSIAFPIGGGVYLLMNKNFTLGLDVGYRWTITDYIDDASGYYYNNDLIDANYGKLSAYFANPSVALEDVPNDWWYQERQPRGNSGSKDSYLFAQITLSKSFTPSISNKPHKEKKRKVKHTYKNGKKVKQNKRRFNAPNLRFGKRNKKFKINTF